MLTVHFAFLFVPVLGLGYMFYMVREVCDNTMSLGRIIPMLMFVLYSGFILSLGMEGSIQYFNDIGYKQGLVTFALPGIGLALAAFPEPLSGLRSSSKFVVRTVGWFMIAAVAMRHMVMMG